MFNKYHVCGNVAGAHAPLGHSVGAEAPERARIDIVFCIGEIYILSAVRHRVVEHHIILLVEHIFAFQG